MSSDAPTLLEELDARQNELLDELDRLNSRIQAVIAKWSASDEASTAAAATS